MRLDCCKTFCTDHMLNTAGILCGDLRVNAKLRQTLCKKFVAFIDHFRNLATCIGQIDKACIGYRNLVLLTKVFHSDADAGFLESEFIGDINGSYDRKFFT